MKCCFEVWDAENKCLDTCGKESTEDFSGKPLCPEHMEFVRVNGARASSGNGKWKYSRQVGIFKKYQIPGGSYFNTEYYDSRGNLKKKAPAKKRAPARSTDDARLADALAEIESLRRQLAERTAPVPVATGSFDSLTLDQVAEACKRLLADSTAWKGRGISPIVWGAAIYKVKRGEPPSEKQYNAIKSIANRNPGLYSQVFATA